MTGTPNLKNTSGLRQCRLPKSGAFLDGVPFALSGARWRLRRSGGWRPLPSL